MNLSEIAFCLQYTFLSRARKAEIQCYLNHQQNIMRVMSVLPGNYRYAQVEAAINAAGVHPETLYVSLASGNDKEALTRFYEALRNVGDEAK
jgi:hypothetical protein